MAKRLLIIEDDQHISDLICRVAREDGFETRSTCNFLDIGPIYDEFLPHVIVLDIVMPEMDGFEVLNFLNKRACPSRIIIVSGQDTYRPIAERMANGLGLSIAATIAKPFRIKQLREALASIKINLKSTGKADDQSDFENSVRAQRP